MYEEIILLVIGLIAGFAVGFFYSRYRASKPQDLSEQNSTLGNLATQIAEMKGKFSEIETSRERVDIARQKYDSERDARFSDFVTNMHALFDETSKKSNMSDAEKEKRIQELMEQNKRFFEEQKTHTEQFLIQQATTREELEKKRDAQIADMNKIITTFTKTVSGTKTRGMMGEEILKEALCHSIRSDVVKCPLNTEVGPVEFAWNLEDGKYIPIDSKLPDVFQLLESYNTIDDPEQQKSLKKEIIDKVKKEIKTIQQYQNLTNTIDSCLLVVPEGVLEIAPELVSLGKEDRVFVCSYKDVIPIAHVLEDQYIRLKEEGDVGQYKLMIRSLFSILEKINKKAEAIDRAVKAIQNANDKIKKHVSNAKKDGSGSETEDETESADNEEDNET